MDINAADPLTRRQIVFTKSEVALGVVAHAARFTAASASKSAMTGSARYMWGGGVTLVPVTAGILAALSEWDHHVEKKRITHEYQNEIASSLGKPVDSVHISDMEKVAQDNPVIGEALQRSVKRRNLSAGVAIAGTVAAFALAAVFAAPLAGAIGAVAGGAFAAASAGLATAGIHVAAQTLIGAAASAVMGAAAFMGVQYQLYKYGKKKLGLNEPPMDEVKLWPGMQSRLSVPSQVRFLEEMQQRGKHVSQEQAMTVFTSANPELDHRIESRFGESFGKLSAGTQVKAVQEFGGLLGLAKLTDDINNHNMRAQELAFAVHNQSSHVQHASRVRLIDALHQLYTAQRLPEASANRQQPEWRLRVLTERQLASATQELGG